MKMYTNFLIVALSAGVIFTLSHAAEKDGFTELNASFKEIQSRVTKREPRSNAIVSVNDGRNEAFGRGFLFRIKPRDDGNATIELFRRSMVGDSGERCVVPLDDEVKAEIKRQEELQKLLAQDEKDRQAENTKRIAEMSRGELTFGMSKKDIEEKRGRHYRYDWWQELGSGSMIYDDFHHTMRRGTLYDLAPTGDLSADEKNLPFADEKPKGESK